MNTDGRIYKTIVVSKPDKYTDELKERIEELGSLCLNNLNQDDYHPIMMLRHWRRLTFAAVSDAF